MMRGSQHALTATTVTILMPAHLTDIMGLTGLRAESSLALARGGAGAARGEAGVLAVASASGVDFVVTGFTAATASMAEAEASTVVAVASTVVAAASMAAAEASTVVAVA